MCLPQIAAGAFTAYSQIQEGKAQSNYYNYLAQQKEQESEIALQRGERQSELIQDTAKYEGKKFGESAAEFSASQRAALAANGVQGVTAADITESSFNKQNLDAQAIRYNADVKSWEARNQANLQSYYAKTEAEGNRFAARNAKAAAKRGAISTVLGTAAQISQNLLKLA